MVEGGEEGEVGYVLDASAIGALLERLGERGLKCLEGAVTLDLALYELGNVLWKACRLRGAISEEETLEGAGAWPGCSSW
jgi:predicted nucleic acid-binding protein